MCSCSRQATKDLENYDAERHEEFKRYEMLKEHERREYLKSLDQEKREREEKRMEEMKEKHRQHPKVNAPVSAEENCVPHVLMSPSPQLFSLIAFSHCRVSRLV